MNIQNSSFISELQVLPGTVASVSKSSLLNKGGELRQKQPISKTMGLVYVVHFKCNKKLLREYPNLFNYTKDIYQVPGMSSTVNMQHIKGHDYGSHPTLNPFGIIPAGPNIDHSSPHDRARFSS
ncbi:hypothetical protein CCACVL1_00518 [Corchorus capsularis]|uniref:Uncharacterized protein n=1 Tax=Corchorus capsularis TaxID=210143 RepID=A0A1R3KWJ5_COCAP|nr:hypothetical protein CCACVL1_00518 [Corchorus capsularis]